MASTEETDDEVAYLSAVSNSESTSSISYCSALTCGRCLACRQDTNETDDCPTPPIEGTASSNGAGCLNVPDSFAVDEERKSKEWLELQVLEMSPDMTRMGDCYVSASDLLMAHQEVLRKLQSKQSPVEELLKQADQLIATQRPRAEVYAAMAESLGQAWKDLNAFLEQRKVILEYNVSFHSHGEDVCDKLVSLDKESSSNSPLPPDVDSIKRLLARLDESRKSALESLRLALLDGEVLLEKLTAMRNLGTLDSRPGHIIPAVNAAISQVKRWLEALHDRRRRSESLYQQRKASLKQWEEVCSLQRDLSAAEKRLETLSRSGGTALGDSIATAEMLLYEHNKLIPECKEMQEKTLKLTHQAEELLCRWKDELGGTGAAEQVRNGAYSLLDKTSEFLEAVDQRSHFLAQSIQFFRVAATALTKLDQLEVQLTAHQASPGSPQLAQLHAQVSRALEDATAPALHHGYSLLELVGRSHLGAEGIMKTVEEIENRGIYLGSLCTAHKEESLRITQAVRNFIEQYESLYSWLLEVVETFLRTQTDMRGTLPEAREVLDMHTQMLNDFNIKSAEIDDLLRSVNPLCEMAEEAQAHEVQMKGDHLHDAWQRLQNALTDRVDLMQVYVRLHALAMQVQEAWDDVETKCQQLDAETDDDVAAAVRQVEESWLEGQQKFLQLSQMGRNFMSDALKVSDRYLDVRKACLCVESLLEYLGSRQLTVHRTQETWIDTVTTIRRTQYEWTQFITIIQSIREVHEEKEKALYPMLPTAEDPNRRKPGYHKPSCTLMVNLIEDKSRQVAHEWTKNLNELETRKTEAESMRLGPGAHQDDRSKMLGDLSLLQQRMQFRLKEYKTLIQMAIGLFKNLAEVENMVNVLDRKSVNMQKSVTEVEIALKDHQATFNTVQELIKITRQEARQLISLLRDQEPPGITRPDEEVIESYLMHADEEWDRSWRAELTRLERQRQRVQFNSDLHAINVQLDDLSRQLAAMRGQYGTSLAAAKVTSQAFFQFEKTIELLEVRIGTFSSTAKKMITDDDGIGDDKVQMEREIAQMDRKWTTFYREVGETRKMIDLSIDYFTLVEDVEHSFRQGGQLLVTIARKSAQVRTPEEAHHLLNEVEGFVKPQETQLDNKIRKISEMAVTLYGPESSSRIDTVVTENKNMMESFAAINSELSNLANNLRTVEEDKFKQAETQAAFRESLDAARAEAAAAKAAANAAEEARKAAEAAAQAMMEAAQVPPRPPLPAEVPEIPRPSAAALAGRAPTPPKRAKPSEPVEGPTFTILLKDAVVEESKAVKLECKVTGKPTPTITWLKDGLIITNNPDYQTTFDEQNGTCCLTIDETFADDSARFTCQATNMAGLAATTATLTVEESAENRLVPPEFVEPLLDSTAREGQPHEMSCRVIGIPLPEVSWFKNDVCIDGSRDYRFGFDNGICTLIFPQVFIEDGAVFECRAFNEAGDADTAAQLTVEPLEPTEVPLFSPGLSSNVMARTGQRVKLECTLAAGLPRPTVFWLHNNKPIKETRDVKTLVEGNRYLLTITEAFPKDAGTYTAVARNVAGESSTTCNLAVKGRIPNETSDSELASDMEPIKPVIQQALPAELKVREGDKVSLDCVIVAQPEPEVIWYQNDRPVKESSDFQLIFQGDRCSLVIREAFQEDSGVYRVVAVNSAGEVTSHCALTVTPLEDTKEQKTPVSSSVQVSVSAPTVPPVFTQTFGNTTVDEGGQLTLDCTIVGQPTPLVKWYHNDQLILPSNFGPKATKISENQHRLNITIVRPDQAGQYKCVAESESGVASCVADITVVPKPPEDSFVSRRAVFSQSSTVFTSQESSFKSVTHQVQQTVSQVGGQPTKEVRFEEVKQVEQEEGQEPVLSVKQRASLFAGGEPAKVVQPKKVERKAVAPKFTTTLTGVMVEQGDRVQLEAILDGHPAPDVKWYKNGVEIATIPHERERFEVTLAGQIAKLCIENVRDSDAGRYTCTARNLAGIASCTADVVVRRTQFPPVFGRRLQAQTVRPGSRVTMEVEVTGTPVPEVSWSKDDKPLITSDRIAIHVEGTRQRIVIMKVNDLDAGRYTVRATNRAGEAVSTAELFVCVSQLSSDEQFNRKHPPLKVDVTRVPQLQPEPPPEVLFAPKSETPKSSGSSGRIDFAEKTRILEEASKIVSPTEVPGRVRLLPMPSSDNESPPRNVRPTPPPELPARKPAIELSKFEPFPQLEPFPFSPDPPKPEKKKANAPPPRKPKKFVRGESKESDYESDLEGTRITPRWVPPGSDTDTESISYRKIRPKLPSEERSLSRAMSKEPTPPTQFDVPPEIDGPPRPVVLPADPDLIKAAQIESRIEETVNIRALERLAAASPKPSAEAIAMEKAWVPRRALDAEKQLPKPLAVASAHLKPSAQALEMEKQWSHRIATPKSKIWPPPAPELSQPASPIWGRGKMEHHAESSAITPESTVSQSSTVISTSETTMSVESAWVEQQSTQQVAAEIFTTISPAQPEIKEQPPVISTQEPARATPTLKEETSKQTVASTLSVTKQATQARQISKVRVPEAFRPIGPSATPPPVLTSKPFEPFPDLEPFPFKPDPPRSERKKSETPTLRKPGKFIQRQFTESDYESDLEGARIAPRWVPPGSDTESETSGYKKVRPPPLVTDPDKRKISHFKPDKTPSPPSKFDKNPPQFDGPPRPEFKKPSPPPPAVEPDLIIPVLRKPSITGTETTQRVQMEESTRFCKRFVTMEQTTRTVQLFPNEQPVPAPVVPAFVPAPTAPQVPEPVPALPAAQELPPLEPFPFVPDPPQPSKRKTQSESPLPRPSKFIPAGSARESDYESDYDGAKIRPRWTPAGSDAEHEPTYRRVKPKLKSGGTGSRKQSGARTPTPPTVFDQPPSFDGPPRPVISPTDAAKIKSALESASEIQIVKPKALRPVANPYYMQKQPGYVQPAPPVTKIAQEKVASHFGELSSTFRNKAQHFAEQVIADVKAKQPADDKQATSEEQRQQQEQQKQQQEPVVPTFSEPQAYHEESRASEFGTKHIDPDTGLIYFKYDFGYEFGLVLPGQPQKVDKIETSIGKEGTIEIPVLHERSVTPSPTPRAAQTTPTGETVKQPAEQQQAAKEVPNFKPKKFQYKANRWEPTDSEISDQESARGGLSKYYEERKESYNKFKSPSPQGRSLPKGGTSECDGGAAAVLKPGER